MRILIIGATGTIGQAIASALDDDHDLVLASQTNAKEQVDIADAVSIHALYERVGRVDAVISAAGEAVFKPLDELENEDFSFSIDNKLMGQANLVRLGLDYMKDGGSFTLTSGVLARQPQQGSAAISLVNAGLEGFARAAALEAPRDIRVNVVSPPWVSETLKAMGLSPEDGLPADVVAQAYVQSLDGTETGQVITPRA